MKQRLVLLLAVVCVAATALPLWGEEQPPLYTRIATWTIQRVHWEDYEKEFKRVEQPALEKLLADGVIVDYGADSTSVHTPEGPTHTTWFSAKSLANLERALDALVGSLQKLPAEERRKLATDLSGEKHRDFLVESRRYRSRAASLDKGYDITFMVTAKPGKSQQYEELWEKYTKPVLDQLFDAGTLVGYALSNEYIHTEKPGSFVTVIVVSNADALDKVEAAFESSYQKRSALERQAVQKAYEDVIEEGSHRDGMFQIFRYASK
ncbi:MAG: hypothetical protein AB1898_31715 [Acidobacteriota bacterium]